MSLEEAKKWHIFAKKNPLWAFLYAFLILIALAVVAYIVSFAGEKGRQHALPSAKAIKWQVVSKKEGDSTIPIVAKTNRPILNIKPVKYENGQFWKINRNNKAVCVSLKYEIENVGNAIAKDISLPNQLSVAYRKDKPILEYHKMKDISIGPGGRYIIEVQTEMVHDSVEKAESNFKYMISDKSRGVTFQLPVTYTNDLDKSKKYQTILKTRIHNTEAKLIDSQMIVIDSNKTGQ